MLTVTNDVVSFFEKDTEKRIIIYGAGNAGKWIGIYMNRLKIDYYCYIDRNVERNDTFLNGKQIFKPEKLQDFYGESLKILISAKCYKDICSDLLWLDSNYCFNALCFVPQYMDIIAHDNRYNINKFLGYFRRQLLLDSTVPTFISNDCTAGLLYESFGMVMRSPTINTGFETNDFLKFCYNLKKYLACEVTDLHWERRYGYRYNAIDSPIGKLDDISIIFGHENNIDVIVEKWRFMRENINWNRIIFVMQDGHASISREQFLYFDLLKEKHLFVNMRSSCGVNSENIVFFKSDWLHDRECVIENNFDLVEWINH